MALGVSAKNAHGFRAAHRMHGCKISRWSDDMLGRLGFTVSKIEGKVTFTDVASSNEGFFVKTTPIKVALVEVVLCDLGFVEGASLRDIYHRGREFGLKLCPSDVGPQLRLEYKDQHRGEICHIAMEPIIASGGCPGIFCLINDEAGLWLDARNGRPQIMWGRRSRWIFMKSNKS